MDPIKENRTRNKHIINLDDAIAKRLHYRENFWTQTDGAADLTQLNSGGFVGHFGYLILSRRYASHVTMTRD